jgi:hypothetical protein
MKLALFRLWSEAFGPLPRCARLDLWLNDVFLWHIDLAGRSRRVSANQWWDSWLLQSVRRSQFRYQRSIAGP